MGVQATRLCADAPAKPKLSGSQVTVLDIEGDGFGSA